MKTKYVLIFFIFGICIDFIGVLLKILHHPFANTLLIIGTVLKVLASLLFLFKLLTHPKLKEFLNQ
jgi:hypothetical protein